MRYSFQTFGCRLNRAEALDMESHLAAEGHEVVPIGPDSEVIVVRGCSVTKRAQRDCEKFIDHLRSKHPEAKIVITGCLPGAERNPLISATEPPAMQRTARAYLKVQDGCSNRCAFCIVPTFRGPPVSVPFSECVTRGGDFAAAGFREIVVTGCNLALYRSDGRGLGALLDRLAQTEARIRLGSLEPGVCDDKVLDAFEANANLCRFLHLSVQSGSNAVLKRMNRHYTTDHVIQLCEEARRRLGKRLNLGADIICGFPGETEEDFEATISLVKRCGITNLHAFPYSERPGTAAAEMTPVVPREVRHDRVRRLEAAAKELRERFAESFIGQQVEICVENAAEGTGWSSEYLPCKCEGCAAERRSLLKATVSKIENGTLLCRA